MAANELDRLLRHKLEFARYVLSEAGLSKSGTRPELKERFEQGLASGRLSEERIAKVLAERDSWGNQSIKVFAIPDRLPNVETIQEQVQDMQRNLLEKFYAKETEGAEFPSPALSKGKGKQTKKAHDEDAKLGPPILEFKVATDLSSFSIFVKRSKSVLAPAEDLAPRTFSSDPDVIWKPFRSQDDELVSFIEVDHVRGHCLLSTRRVLKMGQLLRNNTYVDDVANDILSLARGNSLSLSTAISKLASTSYSAHQISVSKAQKKFVDAYLEAVSESDDAVRRNQDVQSALKSGVQSSLWMCNCHWHPVNGLDEKVHTVLFNKDSSINVLGEVSEASVRFVLSRILEAN
jgi:hypothetical protein